MNMREFRTLLKVSLIIAVIIFFTSVFSEFSVRMYYSSTEWWVQALAGLIAIGIITLLLLLLLTVRDLRRAVLRVFGIETPE